jgi:hypothetical protein
VKILCFLVLLSVPASAVSLQQDCRGSGSIGTAVMSPDGTITLNFNQPAARGVLAYRRGDPQYVRVLSHIGGIRPGERKSVPPWC